MKLFNSIFIFTLLFPLVSNGEQNFSNAGHREIVMSKNNSSDSLAEQERTGLIDTIKIVMKIVVGHSFLEEQKKLNFFDSFKPFYPKNGPINRVTLTKKDFLVISFFNDSKEKMIWNKATISFSGEKVNKVRTLFSENDFDSVLSLNFESVKKELIKVEEQEFSYYLYDFAWKLNRKLRIKFRVQENDFIKEDSYPRDFYMVEISLDN